MECKIGETTNFDGCLFFSMNEIIFLFYYDYLWLQVLLLPWFIPWSFLCLIFWAVISSYPKVVTAMKTSLNETFCTNQVLFMWHIRELLVEMNTYNYQLVECLLLFLLQKYQRLFTLIFCIISGWNIKIFFSITTSQDIAFHCLRWIFVH